MKRRMLPNFIVIVVFIAVNFTALAAETGKVLVAGATGQTGRPLVKILKQQGFAVRAMVRGETSGAELGADEAVKADLTDRATLPAAVRGVDYIITTVGSGRSSLPEDVDYRGIAALTDAAKAAGVKQIVIMSSIGAEITSPDDPSVRRGAVMIAKGKGEAHVRQSGLAYTIVRPGALDNCESGKTALKLGLVSAAAYFAAKLPRICRADVAAVMAAALGNPDALGKTFTVHGDPDTSAPVEAWRATFKSLKRD